MITVGLFIQTEGAAAMVQAPQGYLLVNGNTANPTIPTQGVMVQTTTNGSVIGQNCTTGGFALHDFYNAGNLFVRHIFNPADSSFAIINNGGGPCSYAAQFLGTVAAKNADNTVGGTYGTRSTVATATIIRTVENALWDAGARAALSITKRGHYLVCYSAQLQGTHAAGVYTVQFEVNGGSVQLFSANAAVDVSQLVVSGCIAMEFPTDGLVVALRTVTGTSTGVNSVFTMSATRL